MTAGRVAMLAGLFLVPLLLLWGGHRLRRRTDRRQRIFWGAVIGHLLAVPVASTAAMVPPAEWEASDAVRGALGFWLLLVAPVVGAAIAALMRREE